MFQNSWFPMKCTHQEGFFGGNTLWWETLVNVDMSERLTILEHAFEWIAKNALLMSDSPGSLLRDAASVLEGYRLSMSTKCEEREWRRRLELTEAQVSNTHLSDLAILNLNHNYFGYVTLDAHIDAAGDLSYDSKANVVARIAQLPNAKWIGILIPQMIENADDWLLDNILISSTGFYEAIIGRFLELSNVDELFISLDCDIIDPIEFWAYEYQPLSLAIEAIVHCASFRDIMGMVKFVSPKRLTLSTACTLVSRVRHMCLQHGKRVRILISEYEPLLDPGGHCISTLAEVMSQSNN